MAVNWGVIGCGGIARRRTIPEGIVPCEDARLFGVQDINGEAAEAVGKEFNAEFYSTDPDDVLGDNRIHAVYIATPTHLHHGQVMAAAEAGKHVLCEKPLALTLAECEEMVEACASAGVKLGVNFMMRFHACHQVIKQMIEADELGTLIAGQADLTCWYPPIEGAFRQDPELGGGGALNDMGNHCVDLLEQYFGPVIEICCFTARLVHDYPVEDTAQVMLRFESGAAATVLATFALPDQAARWPLVVQGSKGVVYSYKTIGQMSEGSLRVCLVDDNGEYDASQDLGTEMPGKIVTPVGDNIYLAHIQAFCDAIRNDTAPPIPGEAGVRSHKVIATCYESARTGKAVAV